MKLSLAEQLAKRGLVSKETIDRIDGERAVEALNASTSQKAGHIWITDLKSAKDVHDFSRMAKTILLADFSVIGLVIQEAHRFKQDKDFIRRMYQIRDRFQKCPPQKREQFLSRAFRRHDPLVEIPE
jgi:hypothetical protein